MRRIPSVRTAVGFGALLFASGASAQVSPPLGTAGTYSVLAGTQVTNTGATAISGDVGISPGSGAVGANHPGLTAVMVAGTIHDKDVPAQTAQADQANGYTQLDLLNNCTVTYPAGVFKELANLSLGPGVYCAAAGFHLTNGPLTLAGPAGGTWVFKSGVDLIITGGAAARVISPSCNVWWRVVSTATFDANSSFLGNVLADTSITLAAGAKLSGRAFARTAEVTLSSNAISACVAGPPVPSLVVPTLSKAFLPTTINAGGVSRLTITLNNPNATAITLTAPFVDNLPAGVVVAAAPGALTSCTSGAVTAAAGSGSVTLGPGALIPAGSCTIGVNVTGAIPGTYVNTIPVGALQTDAGNNPAPASATLTVVAVPLVVPTIAKAFAPTSILVDGVSRLSVTLNNPNASNITLTAPFVDNLPSGVLIAASPGANTTCSSGTVTAVAGSGSFALSTGASIPSGSCTIFVNVTGPTPGTFVNTIPAGALQTSAGNNPAPASATLIVTAPPPVPVPVPLPPCVPSLAPTITSIANQVIPPLPAGGSIAVGFTVSGSVIPSALLVSVTSSDTTLVPASAMVITSGVGGARVLTVQGADGRSGVTTITITVVDPSNSTCTAATSTSFQLTILAVAVPTLTQWAFVSLAMLLTLGGIVSLRRRDWDVRR